MKNKLPKIKKYPLSYACAVFVVALSVMPFDELPDITDVPLMDKWTHMVMYGGLSLIAWCEHLWHHHYPECRRAMFFAYVCPVMLGVSMELVQWPLPYRSAEFLDVIANTTGATLTSICGVLYAMRMVDKQAKAV